MTATAHQEHAPSLSLARTLVVRGEGVFIGRPVSRVNSILRNWPTENAVYKHAPAKKTTTASCAAWTLRDEAAGRACPLPRSITARTKHTASTDVLRSKCSFYGVDMGRHRRGETRWPPAAQAHLLGCRPFDKKSRQNVLHNTLHANCLACEWQGPILTPTRLRMAP